MTIKQKLQSKKGFSISEMLMAVLILTLTLSFLGGGIVVVKAAYEKITLRAEARTLLSTSISAVSNEIQHSQDIKNVDGHWSFYSTQRGYRIYFDNMDHNIYVKTETGEEIPLLTEKTITSGLIPTIENIKYENQIFSYEIKIYYEGAVYEAQEIFVRPINVN